MPREGDEGLERGPWNEVIARQSWPRGRERSRSSKEGP
jgi:hypothetical protein